MVGKTVSESETSRVVRTTFHLRNVSDQAIRACQVSYDRVVDGVKSRHQVLVSFEEGKELAAGGEAWFVIEGHSDAFLRLWTEGVEFIDGRRWKVK